MPRCWLIQLSQELLSIQKVKQTLRKYHCSSQRQYLVLELVKCLFNSSVTAGNSTCSVNLNILLRYNPWVSAPLLISHVTSHVIRVCYLLWCKCDNTLLEIEDLTNETSKDRWPVFHSNIRTCVPHYGLVDFIWIVKYSHLNVTFNKLEPEITPSYNRFTRLCNIQYDRIEMTKSISLKEWGIRSYLVHLSAIRYNSISIWSMWLNCVMIWFIFNVHIPGTLYLTLHLVVILQ